MKDFINALDEILLDELEFVIEDEYAEIKYVNWNDVWDGLICECGWKGLIFGIGFLKLLDYSLKYFEKEDINCILKGFNPDNYNGSIRKLSKLSNIFYNTNINALSIDELANFNQYFDDYDDNFNSYNENCDKFIEKEEEIFYLLNAYLFSFSENIISIFNHLNFSDFIFKFIESNRLSYFLKNLNKIDITKNYFSSINIFVKTVFKFIDELRDYEFINYPNILNQPGKKQIYRDRDLLRDEILVEFLFNKINIDTFSTINVYIPCCDNINIIFKLRKYIKSKNNNCVINFYGKINFNNALFDTTKVIMYSLYDKNVFLSYSQTQSFPFENYSLENMDFVISDYLPKDIYEDGNFIHKFQYKLNHSLKLVMIIDKEQYSNNYINFIVLNDNLESIITFEDFFILILNSNKPNNRKNMFILVDYALLDSNYVYKLDQYKNKLFGEKSSENKLYEKELNGWICEKKSEKINLFCEKDFSQYIPPSLVNLECMNNILEVYTNFSNTNFSKVILNNNAVKDFYQFESRKNWGEYYFDDVVETFDTLDDLDDMVETFDTLDNCVNVNGQINPEKIYDINFYLENFNYNNLIYDLKRKPYSLFKQKYVENKLKIVEEKLEFIPLYSIITFDVNEIDKEEIETRKIQKFHHEFYIKSDKILRDFLLYYLDSDKGKEEYNFFKEGFGFEKLDSRYVQSGYTTRAEFIYMRIPLVGIETQKKIIKAYELNNEHYDLVKKSKDYFKSNILNYEKTLKDMEYFNKMEIDTKNGKIVEMSTVKRHMFDGLLWPLSISYLNAVHGTHVSNPNEKLDFYLKLFEFLTAFIDIILVSAIPEDEYDNLKQEIWDIEKGDITKYYYLNVAFGTWTKLYSNLLKIYSEKNIKPKFGLELIESFLNKDIYKIMDDARKIRNKFPGHGASIPESRAQQLIDDLKLKIDVVYDIFGYLTGFKLFYAVKVLELFDDGSNLYEVISLNGPCDQPIYGKVTFNQRLKNNSLYLNNSLNGDLLELNKALIRFEELIELYDDNGKIKERATGRFNLYLFNGFYKNNNMEVKYKCYQTEIDEIEKVISFDDWDKFMYKIRR